MKRLAYLASEYFLDLCWESSYFSIGNLYLGLCPVVLLHVSAFVWILFVIWLMVQLSLCCWVHVCFHGESHCPYRTVASFSAAEEGWLFLGFLNTVASQGKQQSLTAVIAAFCVAGNQVLAALPSLGASLKLAQAPTKSYLPRALWGPRAWGAVSGRDPGTTLKRN